MRKLIIILLIILVNNLGFSAVYEGSEFFNSHISAMDQGIGGVNSINIETPSSILVNPATGAYLKQIGITTTLGGFTSLGTYGIAGLSYPSKLGTFSGQLIYYGLPREGAVGGVLAFSKDVADELGLGFGITATSAGNIGINLGFVYKAVDDKTTGIGLKKLVYGASLLNLGLPAIRNGFDPFPSLPTLRGGIDLMFLRTDPVKFHILADVGLGGWGLNAQVNGGLAVNILDTIIIRGGGLAGLNQLGYSFGATAKYTLEKQFGIERLDIRFHYSFLNVANSVSGIQGSGHWFGFDFALGTIDTTPPKIDIDIQISKDEKDEINISLGNNFEFRYLTSSIEKVTYISPNYDGKKDKIKINLGIQDESILKSWKIVVKDKNGNDIKTIESKIRRDVALDFGELINRLFSPKESIKVPNYVYWDGTDNKGKVVQDGEYFLQVFAEDIEKNTASSPVYKVIVDNTPPSGDVSVDYNIFSPDGDGVKDNVTFTLKNLTPGDEWIAQIVDQTGNAVIEWKLGTQPPSSVIWTGLDKDNKLLPDGTYSFLLKAEDLAGNIFSKEIKNIIISTKKRSIILSADYYEISPNSDSLFDNSSINILIDDTNGLEKLNVYVKDPKTSKVLRIWTITPDKFITNVYWDGTDDSGNKIQDDVYVIYSEAQYVDGNKPISPEIFVKVDSTPPSTRVSFTPPIFSPDGDGIDDEVKFNFEVADDSEIKEWKFRILLPRFNKTFKEFSGTGTPPREIIWDGIGDNGESVDSAEEYPLTFEIVDKLGNKTTIKPEPLPTDILIEVTPYGYKIRVSSIEFAFGSSEVTPQGEKIVKRIAEKLRKFPNYKIRVEGHTDNIGSYDYNLKLSQSRAEAVRKLLIKYNIKSDMITAQGFSFDRPIAPNDTEEGRARNRRVEFILIKQ